MKLFKFHAAGKPIWINSEKIFYLMDVSEEKIEFYKTALCIGHKANGDIILLALDETPEQVLEILLGA